MNNYWFKRYGWSYIPISIPGSLLTIFAVLLAAWFFWTIDRKAHSVSDALIHFFVYFTCVAFWWKWIAESTAEKINN